MIDYLIYKGSVSVFSESNSGKKKLKSKHNAGTLNLARLFAGICTADTQVVFDEDNPSNYIGPYYIDIQTSLGESAVYEETEEHTGWGALITNRECLLEDEQYTYTDVGKKKIKDQNWRTRLKTKITRDYINQNIAAATKICLLDYNHNVLAEVDFSDHGYYGADYLNELFNITNNVVIVWELELLCPDEGEWE